MLVLKEFLFFIYRYFTLDFLLKPQQILDRPFVNLTNIFLINLKFKINQFAEVNLQIKMVCVHLFLYVKCIYILVIAITIQELYLYFDNIVHIAINL